MRPKTVNPFYRTKAWKLARQQALVRDNHLCQRCRGNGFLSGANTVHHIKPIETHPWLALALENLQSLCAPCHNAIHYRHPKKAAAKHKGRARVIDV